MKEFNSLLKKYNRLKNLRKPKTGTLKTELLCSPRVLGNCQINAHMEVQNVVEDFYSLECQSEAPCKKIYVRGLKFQLAEV